MKTKRAGLTKVSTTEVIAVLTNDWQSARLISAQLVISPDALWRSVANNREGLWKGNRNMSIETAKAHMTTRFLRNLVSTGVAEKRKCSGNKNEYRLAQPKD